MANRDGISKHKASDLYIGRRTVTLLDGSKKRVAVYGKTYNEAKSKLDEKIAEAKRDNPVNKSHMTVEQYLRQWLPLAKGIRESTRNKYGGELRKYVFPNIGNIRLCNLSVDRLQAMFDKITREGEEVGRPQITRTCQIIKAILSKAFKDAKRRKLIGTNLATDIELKDYSPKETAIWKADEAKKFMELAKEDNYYFFFAMYITYGVRRGEAIALRWEDVDFEEGLIHIRQQYTSDGKNGWHIIAPKTKMSIRTLAMTSEIKDILRKLSNSTESHTGPIISCNGNYINPRSVNWHFKKLKKASGITDVKLHSLRHFAATGFKRAKVSPKDAQVILGHSTVAITENIYQHCEDCDNLEAMEQYNKYLIANGIGV